MTETAEKANTEETQEQTELQTMKAVILPLEQYNEIMTGLQHAPKNVVDPIIRGLGNVQVHDVRIGPRET